MNIPGISGTQRDNGNCDILSQKEILAQAETLGKNIFDITGKLKI